MDFPSRLSDSIPRRNREGLPYGQSSMEATTRERIADMLRAEPASASELAAELAIPTPQVYEHVRHVAQSVGGDEQFLVAAPECRDCGFDDFDDPIGNPSKCPDCKSEALSDARFTIE